jgi:hypothetical protein
MGTPTRKSGIIAVCFLLICTVVISVTLITILTTTKGNAWAQDFKDSHTMPKSIVVEIPSLLGTGAAYDTIGSIESHIQQSRENLENHLTNSYNRLHNPIGQSSTEDVPESQSDAVTDSSSQTSRTIEEHIQQSGERLESHIQASREWLENH